MTNHMMPIQINHKPSLQHTISSFHPNVQIHHKNGQSRGGGGYRIEQETQYCQEYVTARHEYWLIGRRRHFIAAAQRNTSMIDVHWQRDYSVDNYA